MSKSGNRTDIYLRRYHLTAVVLTILFKSQSNHLYRVLKTHNINSQFWNSGVIVHAVSIEKMLYQYVVGISLRYHPGNDNILT